MGWFDSIFGGGSKSSSSDDKARVSKSGTKFRGEKFARIAVHTGARVLGQARPSEVLVSSTVKDLVAGSGLRFRDRGTHSLKGVFGEWRLFAAE